MNSKSLALLAAMAAFAAPIGPAAMAPPPREPRPRLPTEHDLSRLEAAAVKRSRRAARRQGVRP